MILEDSAGEVADPEDEVDGGAREPAVLDDNLSPAEELRRLKAAAGGFKLALRVMTGDLQDGGGAPGRRTFARIVLRHSKQTNK